MFGNVFKADMAKVLHWGLLGACALFCLAVALLYLVSRDAAWIRVDVSPVECWGFIPDPASLPQFSEDGFSAADSIACAAVAHTVFFPVLALVFLYRFFFGDARSGALRVSLSRGVPRPAQFLSKLLTASVVLQGCYLVLCAGFALVLLAGSPAGFDVGSFGALAPRLALNCLVNESFIVFCMAAYAWIGNGPTAAGAIFLATFVGLIAQMSAPDVVVPAHMGSWIKVCGLTALPGLAPSVAAFSLGSCALLIPLAYAGFARRG